MTTPKRWVRVTVTVEPEDAGVVARDLVEIEVPADDTVLKDRLAATFTNALRAADRELETRERLRWPS